MLNYHEIGKQIRIERIKQDMTIEQLAEKVNLSTSHISGIERGSTKLGLSAFIRIANALKASTDVLLCYNIENPESRLILTGNIAQLVSDCSNNELFVIENMIKTTKSSLRSIKENDGA